MDKSDTARVYPAAPLESVIVHEQQQTLLPPQLPRAPPTYAQATAAPIPAQTTGPALSSPQVVVITQPAVSAPYGPHPVDVLCPFCQNYTRTRIRHKPTNSTHLIALLLCVLQLYCFVCLPYLIASCNKVNHYCGMCNQYLGTYNRK